MQKAWANEGDPEELLRMGGIALGMLRGMLGEYIFLEGGSKGMKNEELVEENKRLFNQSGDEMTAKEKAQLPIYQVNGKIDAIKKKLEETPGKGKIEEMEKERDILRKENVHLRSLRGVDELEEKASIAVNGERVAKAKQKELDREVSRLKCGINIFYRPLRQVKRLEKRESETGRGVVEEG